ncbi:MAG: DsbA family oxidoreductase [Flavobacteriales bacterium]
MRVDIWSDVVCPFCYIGKREFERALENFPAKDQVEVVWRSFELDPDAPVRHELDTYGMLAEKYGRTREQAKGMVANVVDRAKSVGLDYDMDRVVIANSFDAHRLIQLAKSKGLGGQAEERLFKAHFMEGAHIGDRATLKRMGEELGLDGAEVEAMLAGGAFTTEVREDERTAQQLGIRGVPFFVLDNKYAVSGAQSSEHFLGALQQAWSERPAPTIPEGDGPVCAPGEACDPA